MSVIDSRAIIDPSARLAPDVQVGPWSIIGPDVEIGEGTVVGPHVVLKGPTVIGKHNKIYLVLLKLCQKCLMKFFSVCIVLRRNASGRDSLVLRSLEGIRTLVVADHETNLCIGDHTCIDCVHDRLEICTASGYQNTQF